MQRKTLTRTEVATLAVGMLLLVLLSTQALGQAGSRELSNRSVCAANLRGIMQSMVIYAADNREMYPMLPPSSATTYDVTFKEDPGAKDPERTIESMYKEKLYSNNPSADLWIMVLEGQVAAKQFICKSDEFATAGAQITDKQSQYYRNFQSGKDFSYSTTFPWALTKGQVVRGGWWTNTMDAGFPVISDMAPFLGKTAADNAPGPDTATEKWVITKSNSQNHQLDGQNVAFADAHAEFTRTPAVGEGNDSIWGIRKKAEAQSGAEMPIAAGSLPHAPEGVQGAWDTVMVPTRNAKGELK